MKEKITINLPKLGESIVSATVVQWLKKTGDNISLDEPLLEVATDKVNSEIPSPVNGIVKEILVEVDQEVQVGDALAVIEKSVDSKEEIQIDSREKTFFSPVVIKCAKEKGLSLYDLEKIKGTGDGNRVTKKDVESFLLSQNINNSETEKGIERKKMSNMRKLIAKNMVKSFYEAPHATIISDVDVTNILKYIKTEKENFLEKHNVKLTITCFVIQAISNSIKSFPLINSSLEGEIIAIKHYVNIGIAVSLEQGLVVPVLKNCDKLDLFSIAKSISEISKRARDNNISSDDMREGTITLTNFGMGGAQIGIPIIRYPEVAIIGMGAITKKVIVLEDDTTAIRSIMSISLSFDHRVLDGMYCCSFLQELKKQLKKV